MFFLVKKIFNGISRGISGKDMAVLYFTPTSRKEAGKREMQGA